MKNYQSCYQIREFWENQDILFSVRENHGENKDMLKKVMSLDSYRISS